MDIEKANAEATERMMEARPAGAGRSRQSNRGNPRHEGEPATAHAGPPLTLRDRPQGGRWKCLAPVLWLHGELLVSRRNEMGPITQ